MTLPVDNVTVGATSIQLIPENKYRRKITFVNTHAVNTVSISQGAEAFANKGIVLSPKGSFTDTRDYQGYIYKGAYSVISDAAGSVIAITEES